jgi:hypothetical protein
MNPYNRVLHPTNGTDIFGEMPGIDKSGILLPPGLIHLVEGEHYGPNSGFGVVHIVAEHDRQIARKNKALAQMSSHDRVRHYVAQILIRKAQIFVEHEKPKRPVVIHTAKGGVILELRRNDGISWYSVVSAYNRQNQRGELMANLL